MGFWGTESFNLEIKACNLLAGTESVQIIDDEKALTLTLTFF